MDSSDVDISSTVSPKKRFLPWCICGLSFLVQFLAMSFYGSFGPLYVEMLRVFKSGDAATAWIPSLSFSIAFIISPLTYPLGERFGFRITSLVGAVLFGLGILVSSFATSIGILYFTIGVLLAVGHSLCQATSMFILPHYFGDNFSLPLGIALSGSGLGALALSSIKTFLFDKYGYRIGMQILSSIAIPIALAGLAFKKPTNSLKTAEIEPAVEESPEIEDEYPPLHRNKAFYMLLTSSFVYHSVYLVTFVHLTRLAGDLGISDTKSALLPGILTLLESAGKIFAGKLLSQFRTISVTFYQIAWAGMALSHLACPFAKDFNGLIIYSVSYGLSVGASNGACVIVIADVVGNRQLIRGYSIFLMCFSPAILIGPPLAGYLRETTSKYDTAYYLCGGIVALSASLLFAVKILQKMNRERYRIYTKTLSNITKDDMKKEELGICDRRNDSEKTSILHSKGKPIHCNEDENISSEDEFFFNLDQSIDGPFADKKLFLDIDLSRYLDRETAI